MEILIYVVIYLLSVWITRYMLKKAFLDKNQEADGLDLFMCFVPVANICTGILSLLIFRTDNLANKFFNFKK